MLEEAKLKYLQMKREYMKKRKSQSKKFVSNFKHMLAEVESISQKHTRSYFSSLGETVTDVDVLEFEKVQEMFKILILPEKSLRLYFGCLSSEEAKKEFRRYALYLHPDKNSHPSAKLAFQKLFKCFIPSAGGPAKK